MDAVREGGNESTVGIVDRLVGCLQPVLTILGKADPKLHKPGKLNTYRNKIHNVEMSTSTVYVVFDWLACQNNESISRDVPGWTHRNI